MRKLISAICIALVLVAGCDKDADKADEHKDCSCPLAGEVMDAGMEASVEDMEMPEEEEVVEDMDAPVDAGEEVEEEPEADMEAAPECEECEEGCDC